MHPHHQHFFVIRTIEDADLPAFRQTARGAPKKIVFQLVGAGLFELKTWQPCGLTPDMTCRMAPSLPPASIPWKINSNA
jgi:hypothetical protein